MEGKEYIFSGYVKKTPEEDWAYIPPTPWMSPDYELTKQELIKNGFNHFIFEIRRTYNV